MTAKQIRVLSRGRFLRRGAKPDRIVRDSQNAARSPIRNSVYCVAVMLCLPNTTGKPFKQSIAEDLKNRRAAGVQPAENEAFVLSRLIAVGRCPKPNGVRAD